jgi:Holliday junction resolvasome RuvABC endonuclease subunit
MTNQIFTLGIDPGLAHPAFAVLELVSGGSGYRLAASGAMRTLPKYSLDDRLAAIHLFFEASLSRYPRPLIHAVGVEAYGVHFTKGGKVKAKNRDGTLQAIGVIKAALFAHLIPVHTYTEGEGKRAVGVPQKAAGRTHSERKMPTRVAVMRILGLPEILSDHESDAAAQAICAGNRLGIERAAGRAG